MAGTQVDQANSCIKPRSAPPPPTASELHLRDLVGAWGLHVIPGRLSDRQEHQTGSWEEPGSAGLACQPRGGRHDALFSRLILGKGPRSEGGVGGAAD